MKLCIENVRHYILVFALAVAINVGIVLFVSFFDISKISLLYMSESYANQSQYAVGTAIHKMKHAVIVFNISNTTSSHVARDVNSFATPNLKFHYITISGQGRLGNKLFQFASMIGTAERMGYNAIISKNHILCRYFDISQVKDLKLENVKKYGEKYAGKFDQGINKLSRNSNWTLTGYYQSWRYFAHVNELVRKSLKFKADTLNKVQKILHDLQPRNATLVGVHVRRGDMNTKYELKRGYNVAPLEYINNAMAYFEKKYKNIIFVAVSDDKSWCIKHFKKNNVKMPTGNGQYIDLALLSKCNHTIITSGSFGWWGAWLAGGETVYFNGYPKPGSWLDGLYSRTDYYPPYWIPMS